MENLGDFLQLLDTDVSVKIMWCLDDPADIVRASSVSHSWYQFGFGRSPAWAAMRRPPTSASILTTATSTKGGETFSASLQAPPVKSNGRFKNQIIFLINHLKKRVIENGLCKRLCLKLFPEVSSAGHAIEVEEVIKVTNIGSNKSERDHKVYAVLAGGLSPKFRHDCISDALSASSTDNYLIERIVNTLDARDRVAGKPSYWSSKGEADDGVPEILRYRLISEVCFVTEILIRPFQAYFQHDLPIYSAKAVRFRLGRLKLELHLHLHDFFEWTYVSPEFPMAQEDCLQQFKLPEPVLCVGGFLQIELLGRVQTRRSDGLFYICVSLVQVVGRTLLPEFEVKLVEAPGLCVVHYCPKSFRFLL